MKMTLRWQVATALAVALLAGAPASAPASAQGACRPPSQNTMTLLERLPADAGYEVLAQVELLDLVDATTPRGQPSSAPTPAYLTDLRRPRAPPGRQEAPRQAQVGAPPSCR